MRVLFCGLGSIGQRHLRNLSALCAERGEALTVDALRATARALPAEFAALLDNSYGSSDAIDGQYDAVFVTNPTSEHAGTMARFADRTAAMFIEKPVFDRGDIDERILGLKEDGFYYVACPMRYHPVVKRMKALAKAHNVIAARAICSSYLPEWRKGTDYRDCYSAKREQGGGVVLDLIHEWDYLTDLFGLPAAAKGFAGHLSPLEITSDDVAVWAVRYPNLVLTLHLDYVGRAAQRTLELICEQDTIVGDMLGLTVTHMVTGETERFEPCDVHRAEMRYFIDAVKNKQMSINTVVSAAAVLRTALGSVEEKA